MENKDKEESRMKIEKLSMVKTNKSVKELLNEAGYNIFECELHFERTY